MKYHTYLSEDQGIHSLPINPCNLLDFNFLKLADVVKNMPPSPRIAKFWLLF